jgi:hypothetical protein
MISRAADFNWREALFPNNKPGMLLASASCPAPMLPKLIANIPTAMKVAALLDGMGRCLNEHRRSEWRGMGGLHRRSVGGPNPGLKVDAWARSVGTSPDARH